MEIHEYYISNKIVQIFEENILEPECTFNNIFIHIFLIFYF